MNKFIPVAMCFLLAGPALAQSVGEKAQSVGEKTGINAVASISPTTTDFVAKAAIGDMFEIKSSELAAERTDGAIKAFAEKMVADHTKTSGQLKALLATTSPAPALPIDLDESHQKMLDKLNSLNGDDFVEKYRADQISAHKDAVSLFRRYAKGGDAPALKDWAGQTLPTLQEHLKMAKALAK